MPSDPRDKLAGIRHFVLDLDGTVYTGGRLHDAVPAFLASVRDRGGTYSFLTNNTSRARREYADKLGSLGVDASLEQICTPVDSTVMALREGYPAASSLFVLGTDALRAEFEAAGFCVDLAAEAAPDAVVVGFDDALVYDRLCRAAWWIDRGRPYLATHPDKVCPTQEQTVLVDCGSICAALTAATGRAPDLVMGKPDPALLRGVASRLGLALNEVAMIGDRLMTDILMAKNAGSLAVLVLTGEASAAQVAEMAPDAPGRPDVVVGDLADLASLL